MKQSNPEIFEDLCLYSEICLLLAEYSFRLFSRRFVHELFMDVDFKGMMVEPSKILGINLTNSASPGAVAIETSIKTSNAFLEGGPVVADRGGQTGGGHSGINNPIKRLGNLTEAASDEALSQPSWNIPSPHKPKLIYNFAKWKNLGPVSDDRRL